MLPAGKKERGGKRTHTQTPLKAARGRRGKTTKPNPEKVKKVYKAPNLSPRNPRSFGRERHWNCQLPARNPGTQPAERDPAGTRGHCFPPEPFRRSARAPFRSALGARGGNCADSPRASTAGPDGTPRARGSTLAPVRSGAAQDGASLTCRGPYLHTTRNSILRGA